MSHAVCSTRADARPTVARCQTSLPKCAGSHWRRLKLSAALFVRRATSSCCFSGTDIFLVRLLPGFPSPTNAFSSASSCVWFSAPGTHWCCSRTISSFDIYCGCLLRPAGLYKEKSWQNYVLYLLSFHACNPRRNLYPTELRGASRVSRSALYEQEVLPNRFRTSRSPKDDRSTQLNTLRATARIHK